VVRGRTALWTHCTRSRAEGRALTGLPLADLAVSFPRSIVRYVIATEVACGRVVEQDGQFSIAPGAFDRKTLTALQTLGPEEPELHKARERDLGAARSDETPERSVRPSVGSEAGREAASAA
jgi:hypothetical protein